jgi:hypothetical protein
MKIKNNWLNWAILLVLIIGVAACRTADCGCPMH